MKFDIKWDECGTICNTNRNLERHIKYLHIPSFKFQTFIWWRPLPKMWQRQSNSCSHKKTSGCKALSKRSQSFVEPHAYWVTNTNTPGTNAGLCKGCHNAYILWRMWVYTWICIITEWSQEKRAFRVTVKGMPKVLWVLHKPSPTWMSIT